MMMSRIGEPGPVLGWRVAWRGVVVALGLGLFAVAGLPGVVEGQDPGGATTAVSGRVLDAETGQPLSNVEVTVQLANETTVHSGGLTDSSGRFRVTGLATGNYTIGFRRLGYGQASEQVQVQGGGATVDLGSVALAPAAVALDQVEVTIERPAVEYAPDRDIYSVEAIPEAAGGVVTDVLATIPGLDVELDGSVSVQGAVPQIYINGRPAPMNGESLLVFLASFPAENIETIEVMANPPARYRAEGAGGIINIVLRRDARLGLNGNAFVNGGSRGDLGAGSRATFQDGPLTLIGGTSVRMTQQETTSSELRQNLRANPITYLGQDATSDRSSSSANLDLQAEYRFREVTTVSVEGRVDRSSADSERITTYTEMDAEQFITDTYDRTSADDSRGLSGQFAVEVEHEFGRDTGHEIQAEFQWERGRDTEESLVRMRMIEDDALAQGIELTFDDAREHDTEMAFSLDYARPLGTNGQLELGFESERGETDETQIREIGLEGTPRETWERPVRGFSHTQDINSFYASTRQRLGDFTLQLGVRAEHTASRFALPVGGTVELPNGGTFENDYLSWFPNANLSFQLGQGKRIRMNYSARVRRPSPNVLNPINRSTDPLNRRVGNPTIDPEYTHSFGMDASWSGQLGNVRLSPFFRRSVDEWAQFKTVDSEGISTSTWENLNSTSTFGSSVSVALRNFHGFGGMINLSGQREIRDWEGVVDGAPRATNRWSIRTNLNSRLTSSLNISTSLRYNPPRDLPQGRSSSTVMTTFSLRQRLFDNRASLSLNVSDPFGIYRSSTRIQDSSLVEVGRQRSDARRLSLSLSYMFGGGGGRGRGGPPGGFPGGGGFRGR